jgi:tripartite-type tricarboxylate transporter receptor subunit TctC
VIRNLHDLFAKAVTSPDVQTKLAAQGIVVGASTPAELVARIKSDTAKFTPIIKASGAAK